MFVGTLQNLGFAGLPPQRFGSHSYGARPELMDFGLLSGSYVLRHRPGSGGLSFHLVLGLRNHRLPLAWTGALSIFRRIFRSAKSITED